LADTTSAAMRPALASIIAASSRAIAGTEAIRSPSSRMYMRFVVVGVTPIRCMIASRILLRSARRIAGLASVVSSSGASFQALARERRSAPILSRLPCLLPISKTALA
jgi:hypothetical protein